MNAQNPEGNILSQIAGVAQQVTDLEKKIEKIEIELANAKLQHRMLTEGALVELMNDAQMSELTTADGYNIVVTQDIKASLGKPKLAEGINWLKDNGHDSIVRMKLVAEYPRGNEAEARRMFEQVRQSNIPTTTLDQNVHHMTLTSFVKEMLSKGEEIPEDIFTITRVNKAVVK